MLITQEIQAVLDTFLSVSNDESGTNETSVQNAEIVQNEVTVTAKSADDAIETVSEDVGNSEDILYNIYTHTWTTPNHLYNKAEVITDTQYVYVDRYLLTDGASIFITDKQVKGIPVGTTLPVNIEKFLQDVVNTKKHKAVKPKALRTEIRKLYKQRVTQWLKTQGGQRGVERYISQFMQPEFLWQPEEIKNTKYGYNLARIYTIYEIVKTVTEVGLLYIENVPVMYLKNDTDTEVYYVLPAYMCKGET